MDIEHFKASLKELKREKQRLVTIIIGQTAALVLLTITWLNSETVVRMETPFPSGEDYRIGGSFADAAYLRDFGLFVALLRSNVTPENVEFIVQALSKLMDGDLRRETRQALLSEAKTLKENGNAISFVADDIEYRPDTGQVFVTGVQTLTTARGETEKKEVSYETVLEMRWGRPRVVDIAFHLGDVPRRNE